MHTLHFQQHYVVMHTLIDTFSPHVVPAKYWVGHCPPPPAPPLVFTHIQYLCKHVCMHCQHQSPSSNQTAALWQLPAAAAASAATHTLTLQQRFLIMHTLTVSTKLCRPFSRCQIIPHPCKTSTPSGPPERPLQASGPSTTHARTYLTG